MAEQILRRHGSWQRLRWNILGVLGCCLIPYLARLVTNPVGDGPGLLVATLTGSLIASLIGVYLLRSLSNYPGVQSSLYIFPSFLTGYGIVFFTFLFSRFYYSRLVFISSLLLCVAWFYVAYFKAQRRSGPTIGIIPVGAAVELIEVPHVKWRVLDDPMDDASDLSAIAADLRADLSDDWERRLSDYALDGLPVYHSKQLHESLTGKVQLEHLSENSFGSLSPVSAYMTLKHLLDWITAALALLCLLPVFVFVAVMIRLDSPGPAIFRQQRIGFRGQPFTCYKFRTMRVAPAAAGDDRSHAMTQSNDQRITRIGRFLRTSRLDELPQILNVLKGEMSWIGPRPEATVLSRWYEAELPFYRYRHIVRPGITGWAQVNQGHVADVDEVLHKLHFDFYYIRRFSPWLDILIVARTIRTMVTGFGAR
ncbi:sugar transferase [Sphingomonas yantingensis]|uniref:Lipopolysaccharide/colanic/teichoic acid biosynthesis glycosyltransferase n=1 Tax=Sphingomonas yantingensis TaxID=1241761 RepID=A0A7W9EKJ5_9SPHN|nr:lipopolysaccharide/colanic/teichoic acid biosynthesis glycosyltransferase [Sphingomonas yantingensis]